jgi:hypothetical protein
VRLDNNLPPLRLDVDILNTSVGCAPLRIGFHY